MPATPWLPACLYKTTASLMLGHTEFWCPGCGREESEEILKSDPSHEERLVHGRGERKQKGISLNLKRWLFLWIRGDVDLRDEEERRKKYSLDFFHSPWPHQQGFFFVLSFLESICDFTETKQPTTKQHTKLLNWHPLLKHLLSCCYAFLGLRLTVQLETWGRSMWVWEFEGLNCRSVQTGICSGQCTPGTRNHIQALPRPQQGCLQQPGAIQRGLSQEVTRVCEQNENRIAAKWLSAAVSMRTEHRASCHFSHTNNSAVL